MYDTAIITRKAHDFKGDAATYGVEVKKLRRIIIFSKTYY